MSSLGTESSSSHERAVAALRARILHRQSEWATSARRRRPRISPVVAVLRRVVSRFAVPVLRSPGLAAWGVTGAALAAFIVAGSIPRLWEADLDALALNHLLYRVQVAVDDARRVLGYDVVLAAVEIERLDHPHWIAMYNGAEERVVFNSDHEFSDDELLDTAGHECVHALFDQASLRLQSRGYDFWTCVLVEETAAYVIGADVAGRVRAGRGGDGAALTEALLQQYRRACDVYDPGSIHQRLWRHLSHFGEDAVDPERQLDISIHFPSASLVDEVEAICRSSRDPYAAAEAIAGRYWPTPTPTPEPDRPWQQ